MIWITVVCNVHIPLVMVRFFWLLLAKPNLLHIWCISKNDFSKSKSNRLLEYVLQEKTFSVFVLQNVKVNSMCYLQFLCNNFKKLWKLSQRKSYTNVYSVGVAWFHFGPRLVINLFYNFLLHQNLGSRFFRQINCKFAIMLWTTL